MDVETKAAELSAFMVRGPREHPIHGRILIAKDDAPEELSALIYETHKDGAFLPDDWSYEMVGDCLSALAEGDNDGPVLDSLYPMTNARNDWYSSAGLCGYFEIGEMMEPSTDPAALIACEMQMALDWVFYLCKEACEALVEATS